MRWLWPGRFAFGKINLIAGLPDRGKGLITCDIIARVTTGNEWPCHEGKADVGNVILMTAEDDTSDTVVPRLIAAGADLKRVHIAQMVARHGGAKRMFSLVDDLALREPRSAKSGMFL